MRLATILIIFLLLGTTNFHTSAQTIPITDIDYKYQLIHITPNDLDCIGTLDLSIDLPTDTKTLIFERTQSHLAANIEDNNLHFLIKSEYPPIDTEHNKSLISVPNIAYGTYFRICVIFIDGSRKYSPVYFINNYISPTDLEILSQQSGLNDCQMEPVRLTLKNKYLSIETSNTVFISIFDLTGKQLLSETISQSTRISLENMPSFVIVKCTNTTNTITKKLFIP